MSEKKQPQNTPPVDNESYEQKLISLALQNAEKKMIDGTASSQIIKHFLDLGSTHAAIELEKLKLQNKLLKVRITNEELAGNLETMYENVMNALRRYNPDDI